MSISVRIDRAAYGRRTVLEGVAFDAPNGSLTAIIGRNGSGKSTLVSCLAGLMPFEGRVQADGVDLASLSVRERAKIVSTLLQNPRRPHVTVRELVGFGRNPYRGVLGRESVADRAAVIRALVDADLVSLADCYVDRISGGEVRRAYFGAMLAQDTSVVLLDEATAFMDKDYERRFLCAARALADSGKTVLSVMHDLSAALSVADRVLLLDGGKQLFFGSVTDLLATDLVERTFSVRRYAADNVLFFG